MNAENKPILIVGSARSGTSVLTWCLGQHPNILPLPETHWIARLSVNMRKLYQFGSIHERYSHLGALDWTEKDFYAEFGRAIDQFIIDTREPRLRFIRKLSMKNQGLTESEVKAIEKQKALSPDPALLSAKNYQIIRSPSDPKGRWVDGTPENTFYMYSMSLLFPNAKFIHLLRNPNDVAKSLMRFSQAGGAGVDHTEVEAYQKWRRYVEYAVKGEKAFGKDRVMRIEYDKLTSSPEKTLRKCLDFLDEKFSEDCLLPLGERINSSKVDQFGATFKPNTQEGKEANAFYHTILASSPDKPDSEALYELVQHYESYASQINI